MYPDKDLMITFGDAIKRAPDGSYGGYLVLFSTPADPDLTGEFFTKDTDYDARDGERVSVYYQHGQDGTIGKAKLGDGVLRFDERGVRVEGWTLKIDASTWAQAQAEQRADYERRIQELINNGQLGWSSGTAGHLVAYESLGKAAWIKRWPLRLDASITPTPAEPRTRVIPLKSFVTSLEAATDGTSDVQGDAGTDDHKSDSMGDVNMDEKQIAELVAQTATKAVNEALTARDARAEAEKAAQATFDAAVKAETDKVKAEYEQTLAKIRRLPGGGGAPYVMHMPGQKWDYLSPSEHALGIAIKSAFEGRRGVARVSNDELQALALKAESVRGNTREGNVEHLDYALKALMPRMGVAAIKSDEIMHADLTSYGLEWVEHMYSTDLWQKIRADRWVLAELERLGDSQEIPDGFDGVNMKLESTDPTWYKVAEAADLNATTGRPDATITASQFVTGEKNITVAKGGARIVFSGELSEDSIIRIAPQALRQLRESGGEMLEHAVIDGDSDTTATTNINDIGGTPAGTEFFLLIDGFRKLAIITNSANSRDGGVLGETDYLETAKLLGTAGMNADIQRCAFIVDKNTYWKSLEFSTVKTKDVWTQATLETGKLTGMWGFPLMSSGFMHYLSAARKADTAGKVNQDTTTNNTKGAILCVRWDQWAWRWKRRMTIETERWPDADANQIVAMMRFGLGYRDTEAAAITYNLTV